MPEPRKDGAKDIPAEPGTIRAFDTAVRKLTGAEGRKRYRLPDGIVSLIAETQPSSRAEDGPIRVTRYDYRGRHGKIDQARGDEVVPSVTLVTAIVGGSAAGEFFEGESGRDEDPFSDLDERHKLQSAKEAQVRSVLEKIGLANEDNEINVYDRTRAEQASDRRTADEIRELLKQGLDKAKGVNKYTVRGDGVEEAIFRKGDFQIVLTRDPSSGAGFAQIVNDTAMIGDRDPEWIVIPTEVVGVLDPDNEDQRLHYRLLQDKMKRDGTETIADPQRKQQYRPRVFDIPEEDQVERIKGLLDLSDAQPV